MKPHTERTVAERWRRNAESASVAYCDGLRNSNATEMAKLRANPSSYAVGVAEGRANYQKGWAPYREILLKLKLPRRYKKGDPRNYRRVQAVAEALHAEKVRRMRAKERGLTKAAKSSPARPLKALRATA